MPELAHGDAVVVVVVVVVLAVLGLSRAIVIGFFVVVVFILLVATLVLHLLKDLAKLGPRREQSDALALVAHPGLEDEPPRLACRLARVKVCREIIQLVEPKLVELVGELDVNRPAPRDARRQR